MECPEDLQWIDAMIPSLPLADCTNDAPASLDPCAQAVFVASSSAAWVTASKPPTAAEADGGLSLPQSQREREQEHVAVAVVSAQTKTAMVRRENNSLTTSSRCETAANTCLKNDIKNANDDRVMENCSLKNEAQRKRVRNAKEKAKILLKKKNHQQMRALAASLEQRVHSLMQFRSSMCQDEASREKLLSLWQLMQRAAELRRENDGYRAILDQKELFANSMQTILDLDGCDILKRCQLLRNPQPVLDGFGFVPFTLESCSRIRDQSIQAALLSSKHLSSRKYDHMSMSWSVSVARDSVRSFRFQLFRVMEHVLLFSDVAWRLMMQTAQYKRSFTQPVWLEYMQKVSDDMVIIRRVTILEHNGTKCHALYLLYRARVNGSVVVGHVSLPLYRNGQQLVGGDCFSDRIPSPSASSSSSSSSSSSKSQDDPREHFVRFHYWYLARRLPKELATGRDDPRGELYRWGDFECEDEQDVAFWQAELWDAVVRFENLVLRPEIQKPLVLRVS